MAKPTYCQEMQFAVRNKKSEISMIMQAYHIDNSLLKGQIFLLFQRHIEAHIKTIELDESLLEETMAASAELVLVS